MWHSFLYCEWSIQMIQATDFEPWFRPLLYSFARQQFTKIESKVKNRCFRTSYPKTSSKSLSHFSHCQVDLFYTKDNLSCLTCNKSANLIPFAVSQPPEARFWFGAFCDRKGYIQKGTTSAFLRPFSLHQLFSLKCQIWSRDLVLHAC